MKFPFLFLLLTLGFSANAQPPGYYNAAYGKTGEALRVALYGIIKGHTSLNYGGSVLPNTWTAFIATDARPDDGKVWDIYSDIPGGTPPYEYEFTTQRCGNGSGHENSCYNHEHVWPQSKFHSDLPMRSDLWIVYPTDYYVNGQRGDLPYGQVSSPSKTFMNGSKIGVNAASGAPSSSAFEPIDSFKGDIARSYFYITTRYLGDSASFQDWEMAVKSTLKPWAIQMLLQWHHNDPVSAKEQARNEAVYAIQGNRNPFIDEPKFADCIWAGNCAGLGIAALQTHSFLISPNPAQDVFLISWPSAKAGTLLSLDVQDGRGRRVWSQQTSRLSKVKLDIHGWAPGIYFLKLNGRDGQQIERLQVQ